MNGIPSRGGPYNLPDDVGPNHPVFNPPDVVECECGEEVYPGDECHGCGREMPTVDELRAEAEDEAADIEYDRLCDHADWDEDR